MTATARERPSAQTTACTSTVTLPKRLVRIAGLLYLLVGIFGGFAKGFVEPKMGSGRSVGGRLQVS